MLVPLFIGLIPAAVLQNRIRHQLNRATRAAEFYRQALLRIDGDWIGQGKTGQQYLSDDELFADDLDLFGKGSLFQFLCTTRTTIGDDTLAAWLTQPAKASEVAERQSAVRELSNHLDLREQLTSLEFNRETIQPRAATRWTNAPAILACMSTVKTVLPKSNFESPLLSKIQQKIAAVTTTPQLVLSAYGLLTQFRLLLHIVCQLVPAIDRWRRSLAQKAEEGLAALGELEAIASLAQYSFICPEAIFPTLVENETCYEAVGLGHPLIRAEERVANDLKLNDNLQFLLVSGSNMSGKSTMLRTVGVNAVLALCGAPVCAKQFRISPFSIGTAIRFQDSLEHGTSHFYAVIKRLRRVMDVQHGDRPLLFLIDEILQGTNSRDRVHGAEAVVKKLIERGGVGLVTTHDIELTRVVDTFNGRAANVHFVDTIRDNEIHFDYKMRPGVVQTSNALALMRKMGLEV